MKFLVTGAYGFIGSHFLRFATKQPGSWSFVLLDSLRYAAAPDRIDDLGLFERVHHDLKAPFPSRLVKKIGPVDYVVHFAAETHVDRSLVDPTPFVEANILGTFHLLEFCRMHQPRLKAFLQVSTDEVYGPADLGVDHDENQPHRPSNPYSATKAAAEDLCYAWAHSMGVPCIISRTMNNIGEMQHSEKYLPTIIRKILIGEIITVHGSPDAPGSRKYLHAEDHARALWLLKDQGRAGHAYNVVGAEEVDNLQMVRTVERIMGKPAKIRFVPFHDARPGHDKRYSLDGTKIASLGWEPTMPFQKAVERTVTWTLEHKEWL